MVHRGTQPWAFILVCGMHNMFFIHVLFVEVSLDRRWGRDRGMTCSKGPQGRIKPRAAAARTQLCTLGTMGVWLTQPPSWVSQFLWMNCSFMFVFQQLWHPLPTCSTWRRRGRRPVPTAKSLKHTSSQLDSWSRQTGKPFLYHKMWKVFMCIKLYWVKKSQKLVLFCCSFRPGGILSLIQNWKLVFSCNHQM